MINRGTFYEALLTRLPPKRAAWLDLHRPSVRSSWGLGPLNGQVGRQRIIRDLVWAIRFDEVLETGTYRGNSTEFFAHVTGRPVHTVEANPRYYHYARARLAAYPDVTVEQGDSRAFLRRRAERVPQRTSLIYLDAHWEEDLPLREEIEIISRGWENAVVIIDDFEVTDDAGYSFDDYGPGKRLTPSYLPKVGWSLWFPTMPSTEETGARRGCGVLVSPSLTAEVKSVHSLRPAP